MLSILNKLKLLLKRSVIANSQQDGTNFYNAQIRYFDKSTQSEIYYPYGYYARPPINSRGFTFNALAQEENQVTFPYEPTTRFTGLNSGEVMVGNQISKVFVKFLNDGKVEIKSTAGLVIDGGDVTINNGNITVTTGDITASLGDILAAAGDVSDDGLVTPSMQDMRNTYNIHTHTGSMMPPNEQM